MARRPLAKEWDDLFNLLGRLSFALRAEADHLDKTGVANEASDVGKMSVNDPHGHATTAYVLRSYADWLDDLVGKIYT